MLRKSYIAATQQLYYIRLQNWAKPNITCEANITGVANITRRKANIAENTVIVVSQLRCFHGAGDRTRTGTSVTSRDFKSLVSTYSTTPAAGSMVSHFLPCVKSQHFAKNTIYCGFQFPGVRAENGCAGLTQVFFRAKTPKDTDAGYARILRCEQIHIAVAHINTFLHSDLLHGRKQHIGRSFRGIPCCSPTPYTPGNSASLISFTA